MSKKKVIKATAVDTVVEITTEIPTSTIDTPVDTDTQTTIETTVDSVVEWKQFIKDIAFWSDFGDLLSPISLRSVRINGLYYWYVKTYRDNPLFSPAFLYRGKGETKEEIGAFYSDPKIKENGGLTGKQKCVNFLREVAKEHQLTTA